MTRARKPFQEERAASGFASCAEKEPPGLYLLGGILPIIPHSQKTHPGSAVSAAEFLPWVHLAHMSETLLCFSLEETGHKLDQSLDLLSSSTLLIHRH